MKVLITGASGRLGSELRKHFSDILVPTESKMNILYFDDIYDYFMEHPPNLVIHCAALTDVVSCEHHPTMAYDMNSTATLYIAEMCDIVNAKMVYISTDHVFDGETGNYNEEDVPNPVSVYAKSKLIGEWYTLANPNNLVIRTSFMKDFPFERAYADKYFSGEKVETIAEWIAKAVNLKGLWHIAGKRKSIYGLAKTIKPNVKPMKLEERPVNGAGMPYLKDTSMDVSKWKRLSL